MKSAGLIWLEFEKLCPLAYVTTFDLDVHTITIWYWRSVYRWARLHLLSSGVRLLSERFAIFLTNFTQLEEKKPAESTWTKWPTFVLASCGEYCGFSACGSSGGLLVSWSPGSTCYWYRSVPVLNPSKEYVMRCSSWFSFRCFSPKTWWRWSRVAVRLFRRNKLIRVLFADRYVRFIFCWSRAQVNAGGLFRGLDCSGA